MAKNSKKVKRNTNNAKQLRGVKEWTFFQNPAKLGITHNQYLSSNPLYTNRSCFSIFRLYNKALDDAEILQNYNFNAYKYNITENIKEIVTHIKKICNIQNVIFVSNCSGALIALKLSCIMNEYCLIANPHTILKSNDCVNYGHWNDEAIKNGINAREYKSEFRALKNTISGNLERTLMKLIVNEKTQKVIGAHMIGPDSAEIIQGIAIAIKAGALKSDFDNTIGIHPSSAEEFVTMRS